MSVGNRSQSVEIPDFTCGAWKDVKSLQVVRIG